MYQVSLHTEFQPYCVPGDILVIYPHFKHTSTVCNDVTKSFKHANIFNVYEEE